jgi:hemolysin III
MGLTLIPRRGFHDRGKDATRKGAQHFRRLPRRAASDPEVAEPIGGQPRPVKPRLRGVSHRWAFFASLLAGVALILVAPSKRAIAAAMVYALSLSALFGVSALYHEVTWSVPVRRWMRRLDHSMIFLLIAGTYTPLGVLVLPGTLALVVLVVVWGGALLGMALNMVWIDAPKWVLRWPDPAPEVFGYHEVFHALVIAAAVAHYAVVAFYVLPRS